MPVDKFGRTDAHVISSGISLSQAGTDKVSKSGDTMTGNLLLSSIGADSVRQLGCTDLTPGKGFSLALGNIRNRLQLAVLSSGHSPLTLETTRGFLVRSADQNVCQLGNGNNPSVILIYKNVVMNSHNIRQLADPANPQDAATKNYVDAWVHKDVLRAVATALTNDLKNLELSSINSLLIATLNSAGAIQLQHGLYKLLVVGNVRALVKE